MFSIDIKNLTNKEKKKIIIFSFIGTLILFLLFYIFRPLTPEEVNQKVKEAVKENSKILKVLENEKNKLEKEIDKMNDKIWIDLRKTCGIKETLDINTKYLCNKKQMEKFLIDNGYDIYQNGLEDRLNALEWFKKNPKEFTKEDMKNLPKGSKITGNRVVYPYHNPDDLFYGIAKAAKPYVTQSDIEHYKANKRLATDIGVNNIEQTVYAPDYKNKEIEYTIKKVHSFDFGDGVELHFNIDGAKYKWILGHTTLDNKYKDGDKVKTGTPIGYLNLTGITTGYHLHIELWQGDNQVLYRISPKVLELRKKKNK